METSEVKKPTKSPTKKSLSSAIRVRHETRKALLSELAKINKKSHGKRVKVDALIMRLLPKLTSQDIADLQEASLSGRDRMEQNYRAYCAKFGSITMDQFLELISAQAMPQFLSKNAANSESEKATFSQGKVGA